MRKLLAPLALALVVAACGQQPAEDERTLDIAVTHDPVDIEEAMEAEPSLATATRSVSFTCQGDLPVTAIYGTDLDGNPDLALIIQGDQYNLQPTPAPSGERYASEFGAEADKGIIWWEQEDGDVLLQQAPSDQVNDPDAGVTARICKVKTEPDPVPMLRR